MKKVRLALIGLSVVAFGLTSCGEKRLTPQEIEAKATEAFNLKKSALETEADASCSTFKPAEVSRLQDSIVNAATEELNAGKK